LNLEIENQSIPHIVYDKVIKTLIDTWNDHFSRVKVLNGILDNMDALLQLSIGAGESSEQA